MKAPTKKALNSKVVMYRKLAADREKIIKTAIASIKELKEDKIKLQAEVFMMQSPEAKGNPKYDVTIYGKYGTGSCVVDVYRMLDACKVTNPQLQHLSKKALFSGLRGHKDTRQDLVDILDSAQSALDMYDDKNNK